MIFALSLLIASAAGQTSPPVKTESQAQFLTVSYAGESGGHSRFRITNTSEHAVTAFVLILLPVGSQPVDGHYSCDGQCVRSFSLADNLRPIMKAKESIERRFDVPADGGIVVAEAAILDDESWAGDERIAAFMAATQFGNQTEYDRIVAAVNSAIAGGSDDAQRTLQIRSRLGSLPVSLENAEVQSFNLWFPDLPDCAQRYARTMKRAATNEKQMVAASIEQFAHGADSGARSLTQWWEKTRQQLAPFGCGGCADKAAHPRPPPSPQANFPTCEADSLPQVLIPVYYLDDGSEADVDEGASESELAAEDTPALNQYKPGPPRARLTPVPPPAQPATEESRPEPSAHMQPPVAPIGRPPSGVPLITQPGGKRWLLWRNVLNRPVSDEQVYRIFFGDFDRLGDMAFHEVVRWEEGKEFQYTDAPAGGLTGAKVEILSRVAGDCNRKLGALFAKTNTIYSRMSWLPPGWPFYAPPLPELQAIRQREKTELSAHIAELRLRLGAASFSTLDGFVRRVYRPIRGRALYIPPSGEAIYSGFLHYVATLEGLSPRKPEATLEIARRKREMHAAGLDDKDWATLKQVALDYNPDFTMFGGVAAAGSATRGLMPAAPPMSMADPQARPMAAPARVVSSPGAGQSMPAAAPLSRDYPQSAPMASPAGVVSSPGAGQSVPGIAPMPMAYPQAAPNATPSGVASSSGGPARPANEGVAGFRLSPEEVLRRISEKKMILTRHTDQLRAMLGEVAFHKLDVYLHGLYKGAGTENYVDVDAPAKDVSAASPIKIR